MTLRRETKEQLLRDLLRRGAPPPRPRAWWFMPLAHWFATLLILILTLYLFAHL